MADLKATVQTLERIAAKLAAAKKQASDFDQVADRIANRFKKTTDLLDKLKTIPGLKIIDLAAQRFYKKTADANKLIADQNKLNEQYVSATERQFKIYSRLIDAQARLARFGASYSEKELFTANQQIQRLEEGYEEARRQSVGLNAQSAALESKFKAITAELNKQSVITNKILTRLAKAAAASAVYFFSGLNNLIQSFTQFNREVVDMDSSFDVRKKAFKDVLATQLAIGTSTEETSKQYQSLAAVGLKFDKNLKSTLRTAVMMQSALGLSADTVATLALWSKVTGANFHDVGDAITFAQSQTELTAVEAAHIAEEFAKINRLMGNSNIELGKITASVSVIAGQIKSLGGSEKAITNIFERFSSLQGVGDAALFGGSRGIFDPSAFSDADKMADAVENIGVKIKQLTGGNPAMLAAIQPMIARMGLTMADARAIMQMADDPAEMGKLKARMMEAKKLKESASALEKRFNERLAETGNLFGSIWVKVTALAKLGLQPLFEVLVVLLKAVNWLLTKVMDLVSWIDKAENGFAKFVKFLGGGFALLFSVLVAKLMVGALTQAAVAVAMLTSRLTEMAAASMTNALGPTGAPKLAGRMLSAPSSWIGKASGSLGRTAAAASKVPGLGWLGKALGGLGKFIGPAGKMFESLTRFVGPVVRWFGTALKVMLPFLGFVGRAALMFARFVPVIGWIITALMAGKWIFDWFNKEKNEKKKKNTVFAQSSDTTDTLARIHTRSGNYESAGNQILDKMRAVAADGVTEDEIKVIRSLLNTVDAAVASRGQAYQADIGVGGVTDSKVLNSRTSDMMHGKALESVLEGEMAKLIAAVKDGSKSNVKIIENTSLKERMEESVRRQADRALTPAPLTYGSDPK